MQPSYAIWHATGLMQAGQDCDGHPHVMGPPVEELKADFPLRPACMGNLVPQQINLWMGAAPKGQQLQAPSGKPKTKACLAVIGSYISAAFASTAEASRRKLSVVLSPPHSMHC